MNKKNIYIMTFAISIITLILILQPYENIVTEILRILFGSIFILFLPGYFTVKSFFKKNEIDLLETFALSFALSISVIPLLTFYVNLMGFPLTQIVIWILASLVIGMNILYTTVKKIGKKVKT